MDNYLNFSLEGKVALVTGAAYGIGFAMAEAFAEAGAKIAFNCRGQHHLEQALADYRAKGIEAHGYICDVTKEDEVKAMVADIEKTLGTIDILVNNAGIIKRIPMHEMALEEFQQVIDIDLVAPFIVSKAVIPGMIKKGHGKIINICSMMSELGRETVSAYAAFKGLIQKRDGTFEWRKKGRERAQQRRFTYAVGSKQTGQLAAVERGVEVSGYGVYLLLVAVADAELV